MLKSSRDVTNVGRSLLGNKVVNKRAELISFPQLAVADTKSFQPAAVVAREPNPIFKRKRKFLRNAFLMHMLMERKGFVT